MTDLAARKASARKTAFAARKSAFAAGQGEACDHLLAALMRFSGAPLAGYLPIRTEIDPRPAMAAHRGTVGVPVIADAGQPLTFRAWTPEAPLIPGPFGAFVPETGAEITPRVLIVPLVAFDRRGYRLGYGGGFYDRTLERLRAAGPVTAIGFAFAAQELDAVPVEPTDQPLDLIVTETGPILPPPRDSLRDPGRG
ncbi:5-formyltetrahydrofolate cyclo-ligase [Rhodobacter capsulatus]|uniref:5-formyltetrahydrofolate cyclo-ligase n=1 Tax=Rhodobacter capsulatus TaxID=1061 RepID=UPI0006DC3EED|nr:5-formyltetrahydrofolate cyclo-ligase [Rhodobacter capsulatus]KQB11461.1 5-formyltetrahydrofolate cyclo-ligase [Rhodobacter capsulatus]KQB12314.1 5-formyltetrahydrofolate cyclo-ligase [Rhodobacter capsulatus]PZX25826.1 5-formyltetrahydrofolate cyclo-ligase [Rhodobacter capsulatus]QNR64127.1 5-formyltetrahydrofolate cyclo-ligase [Rhodobacter capsulatus]